MTHAVSRVPDVAYLTPLVVIAFFFFRPAQVFFCHLVIFQWFAVNFAELKMKERVGAHAVPETVQKRGTVLVQRITGFCAGFTRLRQGQTDPQSAVWSHFGGEVINTLTDQWHDGMNDSLVVLTLMQSIRKKVQKQKKRDYFQSIFKDLLSNSVSLQIF